MRPFQRAVPLLFSDKVLSVQESTGEHPPPTSPRKQKVSEPKALHSAPGPPGGQLRMPVHNQTPGEGPFREGVRGVDARKEGESLGVPVGGGSAVRTERTTDPCRGEGTGGCDPGEVTSSPGVYQDRGRTTDLPASSSLF